MKKIIILALMLILTGCGSAPVKLLINHKFTLVSMLFMTLWKKLVEIR